MNSSRSFGVRCGAMALAAFGSVVSTARAAPAPTAVPTPGPTWDEVAQATFTGFEQLGGQVTLREGKWEGEPFSTEGGARPSLTLARGFRLAGDLDGDGVEEAVVALAESTGGTGTRSYLAVVKRAALAVRHVATAELGDRVLLRSARLAKGADGVARIEARVVRAGQGDALCCPGEVADVAWTFSGGGLAPAGAATIVGRFTLATLGGGTWVLRGWDLDQPAPEQPEVTLAIDGDRIVGSSGCNRYFAKATMKASPPGQLEVGELAGTRLACPEGTMEIENRYRRLLARVERASFLAGQLVLVYRDQRGGFGALRFEERR